MTKLHKYLIAVAVQVLVLVSIIGFKLMVIGSGTDVFLRVSPVDPRSPLRGDFITFEYDISRVSGRFFDDSRSIYEGQTVYVVLNQDNNFWRVSSVLIEPPDDNRVFIKGTITAINDSSPNRRLSPNSDDFDRKIHLTYGIEQYFIEENTGVRFGTQDEVLAHVKIDARGNAVLQNIIKDGKIIK